MELTPRLIELIEAAQQRRGDLWQVGGLCDYPTIAEEDMLIGFGLAYRRPAQPTMWSSGYTLLTEAGKKWNRLGLSDYQRVAQMSVEGRKTANKSIMEQARIKFIKNAPLLTYTTSARFKLSQRCTHIDNRNLWIAAGQGI